MIDPYLSGIGTYGIDPYAARIGAYPIDPYARRIGPCAIAPYAFSIGTYIGVYPVGIGPYGLARRGLGWSGHAGACGQNSQMALVKKLKLSGF